MFISESFAQVVESSAAAPQASFASFIPLILIFLVFYFLLVRPQQKKMRDHHNLLKNLKIGNKVVSSSGIIGEIKDINNESNIIDLKIAENVIVKLYKQNITEVIKEEKQSKSAKDAKVKKNKQDRSKNKVSNKNEKQS